MPTTKIQGLPALSLRDSVAAIMLCAVIAHLIFKRREPLQLPIVLSILALVPLCLSALLLPHYGISASVSLAFFVYLTTMVTSIILYRLGPFHPLASYPGPRLAKVSKWWHVWFVAGGKQHLYLSRLHEKYGDIVRIGPNEVSISDPSCILPLMGANGLPKGSGWSGRTMHAEIPSMIAQRDPAEHARRRRPWNRAFNWASVKEFEPVITSRVHQLVEALSARNGQVIDLAEWIGFFTYDFMGDMVFGGWTEMMRNGGDLEGLWSVIKDGLDVMVLYEHVPWISYYVKKLPWAGKDIKVMRKMGFDRTEKRYNQGSTSRDLFYYLSNEDGAEKVSSARHIVISDGLLALLAGSDTTSSVLSSLIWCLIRHPDTYRRLQAEVDKFYPPGENSLNGKHLTEMTYLEAVINETLRLYPPVMSGSQRAPQIGKGGRVVGPYYIPEGNQARIHFWSVHRDARNFSYPDTFWPDRWLIAEGIQESKEKITHNINAFIPFSFGPSNCVGKNLAMQEMRLFLCHFMQNLDLRFAEGWDPMEYEDALEDKLVVQIGKLPVIVGRRN